MIKRDLFKEKYYLKNFEERLKLDQKSSRTIENYIDNVILFAQYLKQIEKQEFDPIIITIINVVDYIRYMKEVKNIRVGTVILRIQSLKAYFRYLVSEEIVQTDPLKNIKRPKNVNNYEVKTTFDEKTYRSICRLIYRVGNPQHIAIWEVLTRTGLRVGELCSLRIDNLVMNLDTDDISTGKLIIYGKRNIEVPLHNECRIALTNWTKIRKYKQVETPYIFISERGMYTRSGINRIIKKYYAILGLDNQYTVHSCSHYSCRKLN
jgi:integrase/recombinase XerD